MAARAWTIPAAAHTALTVHAAFDGPRVTLVEHIGAAWAPVKSALTRMGAAFVEGTSSFEFDADQDAHALVSAALTAGKIWSQSQSHGYVPTPADLAGEVAALAELTAGGGEPLTVLEPSAGTGRLVDAVTRGLGPEWLRVTAVEVDERRARQIPTGDAVTVVVDTFEAFAAQCRAEGRTFDRVVMNPPFAVPGAGFAWADHLLAAFDLLSPGGRLVAIVPATVLAFITGPRPVRAARELVHTHGGGVHLDADAFAESGVKTNTALVWLDAPPLVDRPAPVPNGPAFTLRTYTGDETPVPVSRPYLTRGAAVIAPVQTWRDGWRGTLRTLRYAGACICCERPVWAFDDGENDPRGALGDAAPDIIDPADHDAAGTPVVACFLCMNDGRATYEKVLRMARAHWTVSARYTAPTPAVEVAAPAPAPVVSEWAQLSLIDA